MLLGAVEPLATVGISPAAAIVNPQELPQNPQSSSQDVPEVSVRSSTSHDIIELQKQLQHLHSRQSKPQSMPNKQQASSLQGADHSLNEASRTTASPVFHKHSEPEASTQAKSSPEANHGM